MSYATIISTAALDQHRLADWVVVDCRFDLKNSDWGRSEYRQAHIPGAIYASLNDDLSDLTAGTGGRHPIPSIESLAATLGRLGIGTSTQVVAYDQDAGSYASRLWWSLRYLGHDAVAVLDGGWAKWQREQRPTAAGDEYRPAAIFTARPRPRLRVAVDDVAAIVEHGGALLIDARAAERFEGREETIDKVAGHIPGAGNHFFKLNLADDGTMLPVEQLRAQYTAILDGRTPTDAVMYCGSGVTACHNLLAMEHAGLSGTPLYPGSWSEWSSDRTRPIETGAPRRRP